MTTTIKNGSTTYHADRRTYIQPHICEEFEQEGDLYYRLDNGRETLASAYNSLWNPAKTKINWKAKAPNPDRTRIEH